MASTVEFDRAPVGSLARHMTIHTNHPKQSTVKLPLSGFIRPMFFVTPETADFGPIDTSQGRNLGLDVRNFSENVYELTEVANLPEGMTAEVKKIGNDDHRFQVILKPSAEMAKGAFETVIQIHTSSEQKPILEVPIKGEVL